MLQAIIILGHRLLPDCSPSTDLISRIDRAVAYWKETGIPRIMPCGGITKDRARSEAEVMREMLLERGVPEEVIRLENESRTTSENMENAVKLLGKGAKVAMVTSEYHIEYALAECAFHGLDAIPVPAETKDPVYREEQRLACTYYMRVNALLREEAEKQGITMDALAMRLREKAGTREAFRRLIAELAEQKGITLPEMP